MSRCIALIIAGCLTASTLAAQTRVTLCGTDVQSGAGTNLAQAIRGGGTIVCGCQPGTRILMTTGHAVPPGTVIDGGDAITLDAEGRAMSMFGVAAGSSLTLQRINIRNARVRRSPTGFPSSVVQASGDLVLDRVTIERSEAPVTVRGALRIAGSRFIANDTWAVAADGTAEIEESSFIGNATGLSIKSGTVHNCVFNQNREGALRVFYATAEVRIISSKFDANHGLGAILLSQRSARDAAAVVTIRRCEFTMNRHRFGGGAINCTTPPRTRNRGPRPSSEPSRRRVSSSPIAASPAIAAAAAARSTRICRTRTAWSSRAGFSSTTRRRKRRCHRLAGPGHARDEWTLSCESRRRRRERASRAGTRARGGMCERAWGQSFIFLRRTKL